MKRTYTFFLLIVGATLLFEAEGPILIDPWAQLGWYYHADISSWDLSKYLPVHIVVSLVEVFLIVTFLMWWKRDRRLKEAFRFIPGTLIVPVLAFAGALTLGVLYGLSGGGNFTFALWEVRGFLMMICLYLLTGIFIRREKQLNELVWVILIAGTGLAIENLLRLVLYGQAIAGDDLAFDHVDSVVMALTLVLSLNLFAFGGTRAQKRFAAISMPIVIFSMELMKRRAAFVALAIGIAVLTIFLLRLRPAVFWKVIPPLAVLLAIYLAVFWNDTSALGQPARAISSQFTPDPRDYASNLYRLIEHEDIILNIQTVPYTGLGFGQQFLFYIPLPNVGSNWPFWHYTTHNAILWVWMKDGVLGFMAFWWLLGRAVYDGARAVETQREEWAFVAQLRSRLGSSKASESLWKAAIPIAPVMLRPSIGASKYTAKRKRVPPNAFGLNVPGWERTDKTRSVTARRSGAVALLVAGICMIPMQVTYSYVDLGLTSERDMLLFGLMLGIIARGALLLGTQEDKHRIVKSRETPRSAASRPRRTTGRPQYQELTPAQLLSPQETHEAVRNLVVTRATGAPRPSGGPRPTGAPQTRPISHPLPPSVQDPAEESKVVETARTAAPSGASAPTHMTQETQEAQSEREMTHTPIENIATSPLSIDTLVTAPLTVDTIATAPLSPSPARPLPREHTVPPRSEPPGRPQPDGSRLPWE